MKNEPRTLRVSKSVICLCLFCLKMYHCSPKYDVNMSFENEIYIPEVGLGHSSKDRYMDYKGKSHKLLWQGAIVTDKWRACQERGWPELAWVPFFIFWWSQTTDQSVVIPIVFTSESPESLLDCLYFDFLLEESDVICSLHRLQRPILLFYEVCYFMFDLSVVTYVSISKRVPIFYLPQLSASFIAA